MIAFAASGGSALWYLTRATGTVAMVLLTLVVVLGVIEVERLSSDRWPRFLIDSLHRQAALLAVVFLAIHIVTSILDPFAPIGWLDAVIPLHSSYRPIWLGLGAVAFDLMLAVFVTSLVRARLGHSTWRYVHWLAYASWPVAIVHGLGTGSDVKQSWMLAITALCVIAVVAAVVVRVARNRAMPGGWRLTAASVAVAFVAALMIWMPGGPLGTNWAARAGTPASLLGHSTTADRTVTR